MLRFTGIRIKTVLKLLSNNISAKIMSIVKSRSHSTISWKSGNVENKQQGGLDDALEITAV